MKFYFQYDRDRKQAKVVIDGDPQHIEIYYVDKIICEVPTYTVLQEDSPQFVVRGECTTLWYGMSDITLTNKK